MINLSCLKVRIRKFYLPVSLTQFFFSFELDAKTLVAKNGDLQLSVVLLFYVSPTAKVIHRQDPGLKSYPKDWRSLDLNP